MIQSVALSFVLMVILDYIWAYYTYFLVKRRSVYASVMSSGIVVSNAAVTIAYVDNHWMLIPTAAGAFVGTFLAIKYGPKD